MVLNAELVVKKDRGYWPETQIQESRDREREPVFFPNDALHRSLVSLSSVDSAILNYFTLNSRCASAKVKKRKEKSML